MRACTIAHSLGMLAIVGWSTLPLDAAARERQPSAARPMRLAIAGLVHGHVRGFLELLKGRTDVELVGIAEPEPGLRAAVLKQYGLADALGFASVDEMLDRTAPGRGGHLHQHVRSPRRRRGGRAPARRR